MVSMSGNAECANYKHDYCLSGHMHLSVFSPRGGALGLPWGIRQL